MTIIIIIIIIINDINANKISVVGDLKQAFLQIRLSLESNGNQFSIIWQTPEGVVHKLAFALAAFPFMLNYVINHLSSYADDCNNGVLN